MLFKTSQAQRVPFAWFVVLCALSAAAFFPIAEVAFTLPKILGFSLLSLCGVIWVLGSNAASSLSLLPRRMTGWFLLLFFVAVVATALRSQAPLMSLFGAAPRVEGVLTYALYGCLFCIVFCLARKPAGDTALLQAILSSNALLVVYGFLQFFGTDPLAMFWADQSFLGRTFSFAGQPNAFALFIVLTFPLVAYNAVCAKKTDERRFLLLLLSMNLVVLFTTASRGGLVGLLAGTVCLLAVENPLRRRMVTLAREARLLLLAGCLGLLIIGSSAFADRFMQESSARSTNARMFLWQDTIALLYEHPLGIGPEILGVMYPQYKSAELLGLEPLRAGVDRAHNKPLDLLVIAGPAGLLAYYAAVISAVVLAVRFRKKQQSLLPLAAGLVSAQVALLFAFDTILTAAFTWIFLGWMLGLAWSDRRDTPASAAGTLLSIVLGLIALCTTALALQWSTQRMVLERAEAAFAVGSVSTAAGLYVQAVHIAPWDRASILRAAESYLHVAESLPAGAQRNGMLDMARQMLDRNERLTGDIDGMTSLLRAWHAALLPDAASLDRFAQEAKNRMPTTVDTYRILAHSYQRIGDTAQARQIEQQLIDLLPAHWQDSTGAARVLWKDNPWLQELLN
jgi:O-antigen ligase